VVQDVGFLDAFGLSDRAKDRVERAVAEPGVVRNRKPVAVCGVLVWRITWDPSWLTWA